MQRRNKVSIKEQIEKRNRSETTETDSVVGPKINKIERDILIPSGSTLVNLACSDNPHGAFAMGTINTWPGASGAGKSFFALTMLACCAIEERFDNYDLVYDDAEETFSFDMSSLFPPLLGKDSYSLHGGRLEPPRYMKEGKGKKAIKVPKNSETIDEFKMNIITRLDAGKPFIYVLDSLDSLSTTEEMERELKAALKSGDSEIIKEARKGYKTGKAMALHEILRIINSKIKKSKSMLLILQQTKDNMNAKNKFSPQWIASGGNAPMFYSFHRLYISEKEAIKDESHNLKYKVGGKKSIEVIKNKLNGKKRKDGIIVPLREDYGIDDVSSCVDFLKKTKHWKSDSGGVTAKEWDIKLPYDELINHIEENQLEGDLQNIVGDLWKRIEAEIKTDRKRRW